MSRRGRFLTLILALLASVAMQAKSFVLVIDAGHGGKDPGAVGRTAKEKNINLAVALAFGRLVEANCPDVKVVYTRKTDVFVTLDGRADIANKAKADFFISIHTNALPKSNNRAMGAETYTLGMHRANDNLEVAKRENSAILIENDYQTRYQGFNPNSSESYIMFEFMQDRNMKQSVSFARDMQAEFRRAGRNDKGVHQAGFLVLRATSMPSALIELGYISTPAEEQFLNTRAGTDKMGRAIYNAFVTYKKRQTGSSAPRVEVPAEPAPKPVVQQPVQPAATPPAVTATPAVQPAPVAADTAAPAPAAEPSDIITTPVEPAPTVAALPITFRVQFMVGHTLVKNVKGLDQVDCYQEDGLYKYTTGRYVTYAEAQHRRNQLAKKYKGAFVVAFRGDVKIDVQEARRATR